MARHHVLGMIVFANEIWTNCFNHFESATKLHIYSSRQIFFFLLARFCYIFVLFPRAADLFLNSVTDGGPVRDAVIMCEKPSNNRIDGDR